MKIKREIIWSKDLLERVKKRWEEQERFRKSREKHFPNSSPEYPWKPNKSKER